MPVTPCSRLSPAFVITVALMLGACRSDATSSGDATRAAASQIPRAAISAKGPDFPPNKWPGTSKPRRRPLGEADPSESGAGGASSGMGTAGGRTGDSLEDELEGEFDDQDDDGSTAL